VGDDTPGRTTGPPQPSGELRNLERTIGLAASKKQEIKVILRDVEKPYIGFPVGLDEHSVALIVTETGRRVLIIRARVARVQRTGRTLGSIQRTGALSHAEVQALYKNTGTFTHSARRVLDR
jgi:hypothetical protein